MKKHLDKFVTGILILFCGVMTGLLIRSEYFPESSPLHQLPPQYVLNKFLTHESQSALAVKWKGRDVGSFSIQTYTRRKKPIVKSSGQFAFSFFEEPVKIRYDLESLLAANRREVEILHVSGSSQGTEFDLRVDMREKKLRAGLKGKGVDEKREFPLEDLPKELNKQIAQHLPPGFPSMMTLSPEMFSSMASQWNLTAYNSKVDRRGDKMDVYVVESRKDAQSWVQLWISPTGEILKLETSFGLSAINEDFFEGIT